MIGSLLRHAAADFHIETNVDGLTVKMSATKGAHAGAVTRVHAFEFMKQLDEVFMTGKTIEGKSAWQENKHWQAFNSGLKKPKQRMVPVETVTAFGVGGSFS